MSMLSPWIVGFRSSIRLSTSILPITIQPSGLPWRFFSVHVCMWPDLIDIAKKNSLNQFGNSRLVLYPFSYTCTLLAKWWGGPNCFITTQVNTSLICQNIYVVNNTFINIIKFVTNIISLTTPFLWCVIIAHIKIYRNVIIIVWPSHYHNVHHNWKHRYDNVQYIIYDNFLFSVTLK